MAQVATRLALKGGPQTVTVPPGDRWQTISDHFRPRRHRLPAAEYHQLLQTRFTTWREVAGLQAAA